MSDYYTLITNKGQADLVAANAGGQFVALTEMALGDGNGSVYDPVESATGLVNERHRMAINRIYQHETNANWLVIEGVLSADVGGWYIREVGIFDSDGDLFAIAKYPETYKAVTADGVGTEINIKIILVVDNIGDVELSIDPSVVYATQAWVIAYHDANWEQSDWDEEDDADKAFILNKPGIPSSFNLTELERLPLFPEIETADNKFAITDNGDGTLTIDAGQTWLYRGWKRFSSDDYTLQQRTLAMTPGKTHHIRWTPASGFAAKITDDLAYNPLSLLEDDRAFDTDYADMLCARVVATVGGQLTIRRLRNRHKLLAKLSKSTNHTSTSSWSGLPGASVDLDWARTPVNQPDQLSSEVYTNIDMMNQFVGIRSRYGGTAWMYGYSELGATIYFTSGTFRLTLTA